MMRFQPEPQPLGVQSRGDDTAFIERISLFVLYIIGFGLRLASGNAPNIVYPDEIFQSLEPAHRLAFGYGIVTWEWRAGVRSWVFPGFLAGLMKLSTYLAPHTDAYLYVTRASLCICSLTAIWFSFAWVKKATGNASTALIAAGSATFWYQLIIFGSRALTEVVATDFLLPALYLGVYGAEIPPRKRMFLVGILLGFAGCLRMELLPVVIFAAWYFCRREWKGRLVGLLLGFSMPLTIFGITDTVSWGYPFASFYRYIKITIIDGRSLLYGTEPWYWYLEVLVAAFGAALVFSIIGARKSHFLGYICLIILISHSFISHKEIRFLYPLIPLLMCLTGIGISDFLSLFPRFQTGHRVYVTATGIAIILSISVWYAPSFKYWTKDSGGIIAFEALSRDPRICGVGVYGFNAFNTGGYTYLHRDVPIILPSRFSIEEDSTSFNALVAPKENMIVPHRFAIHSCLNGICLYERQGGCVKSHAPDEVNAVLDRSNR